jgi:hypothetical protein
VIGGKRGWGVLVDRMSWQRILALRSSTQWVVDAGSRDGDAILRFWSDVERPRWGWECAGAGYISARQASF